MQTKTPIKWEEKTIGDLITLEYGKGLSKEDRQTDGKYPAYGANGIKDWTNKYLYDKKTVIIGRKGSAGEIKLTADKFWALDVSYYAIFNEKELDLTFLYFLLQTLNLPSLAKGVKPGINRNDVYSIQVKIPQIKEQRRIVEILDKAFEEIDQMIENAKQNLQNAKDLFESYLEQVFSEDTNGYIQTTFGAEIKVRSGDFLPARSMIQDGIYPVYGGNGINGNHDQYNYSNENVIIGRVGEKCGNVHYTNENVWVTDNAFVVIETKNQFDKKFLTFLLRRANLRNYAKKSTHPVVSGTSLSNVELRFPLDISKQKKIVEKIANMQEQTQQLEQIYQQKIKQAEELKQSILQKAFNGEL